MHPQKFLKKYFVVVLSNLIKPLNKITRPIHVYLFSPKNLMFWDFYNNLWPSNAKSIGVHCHLCPITKRGKKKGWITMWRKGTLLKNTCETIHIYSIFTWNFTLTMHFNYYQFIDVHKENSVINMFWQVLMFLIGQSQDWSRWFTISSPPPNYNLKHNFISGATKR
jgi:hypothetical protein